MDKSQYLKPVSNLPKTTPKFQSLSSLLRAGGQALLLDCSGSMDRKDDRELRRIDHLRNISQKFVGQIRQFVFFGENCFEIEEIPEPQSSTGLATAISILKGNGISHIILITDGCPDSEIDALQAAEGTQIDAFYVGDPLDEYAIDFLKRLTKQTSGKYGETTLNKKGAEKLENEIILLLEDQSSDGKTINL